MGVQQLSSCICYHLIKQFGVTTVGVNRHRLPVSVPSAPIAAVAMGMESCGGGHPPTKEHSMARPCSKDLCWQSQGGVKRIFCDQGRLWKAWLGRAYGLQSVETCLEANFSWHAHCVTRIIAISGVGEANCPAWPLFSHRFVDHWWQARNSLSVSLRTLLVCSSYHCSVEPDGRDMGGQ